MVLVLLLGLIFGCVDALHKEGALPEIKLDFGIQSKNPTNIANIVDVPRTDVADASSFALPSFTSALLNFIPALHSTVGFGNIGWAILIGAVGSNLYNAKYRDKNCNDLKKIRAELNSLLRNSKFVFAPIIIKGFDFDSYKSDDWNYFYGLDNSGGHIGGFLLKNIEQSLGALGKTRDKLNEILGSKDIVYDDTRALPDTIKDASDLRREIMAFEKEIVSDLGLDSYFSLDYWKMPTCSFSDKTTKYLPVFALALYVEIDFYEALLNSFKAKYAKQIQYDDDQRIIAPSRLPVPSQPPRSQPSGGSGSSGIRGTKRRHLSE